MGTLAMLHSRYSKEKGWDKEHRRPGGLGRLFGARASWTYADLFSSPSMKTSGNENEAFYWIAPFQTR